MEKMHEKGKILIRTGFFHIFGSNVINKIITFLSSVVLVRILSKVEYGAFTYAWNIYSIVLLFNGMGIDSGMLQLTSEHGGNPQYTEKISTFSAKFGLLFDLILSGILLFIGMFVPHQIESGRTLICMLCILPAFQLVYSLETAYLRAQKRNQEFSKLQVVNTALVSIFSASFAFLLRERGMIAGYYVAYLASCLIGMLFCRVRLINKDSVIAGDDKKVLLKISLVSMLNNGLSHFLYLLDVFVLGLVDPQETILASYKVATMIPTALTFIPTALVTYLYPYFAEHKDDGKWCLKRYKQILFGLGGFNLVLSAVLFVVAPSIIRVFFGLEYMDGVPVFRLLAINYSFSGTFRILSGNLLVTQRKLKFNLFVAVVSSCVNIVADYYFILQWGAMGAACATLLVVLVSSILSTGYLIRTFKKNI